MSGQGSQQNLSGQDPLQSNDPWFQGCGNVSGSALFGQGRVAGNEFFMPPGMTGTQTFQMNSGNTSFASGMSSQPPSSGGATFGGPVNYGMDGSLNAPPLNPGLQPGSHGIGSCGAATGQEGVSSGQDGSGSWSRPPGAPIYSWSGQLGDSVVLPSGTGTHHGQSGSGMSSGQGVTGSYYWPEGSGGHLWQVGSGSGPGQDSSGCAGHPPGNPPDGSQGNPGDGSGTATGTAQGASTTRSFDDSASSATAAPEPSDCWPVKQISNDTCSRSCCTRSSTNAIDQRRNYGQQIDSSMSCATVAEVDKPTEGSRWISGVCGSHSQLAILGL